MGTGRWRPKRPKMARRMASTPAATLPFTHCLPASALPFTHALPAATLAFTFPLMPLIPRMIGPASLRPVLITKSRALLTGFCSFSTI